MRVSNSVQKRESETRQTFAKSSAIGQLVQPRMLTWKNRPCRRIARQRENLVLSCTMRTKRPNASKCEQLAPMRQAMGWRQGGVHRLPGCADDGAFVRRDRRTEQIPMDFIAVLILQHPELLDRLHSFGPHLYTHAARNCDDCGSDVRSDLWRKFRLFRTPAATISNLRFQHPDHARDAHNR